jgi:hypothetical protein
MAVNNQPRSYQAWSAIGATPNDFMLDAGRYGLNLKAQIWGTATLQMLQPDGVTYMPVSAAIGANSYTVLDLPAGQYQLTMAGITALTGQIALIGRGVR